jgi:hypothetical protein
MPITNPTASVLLQFLEKVSNLRQPKVKEDLEVPRGKGPEPSICTTKGAADVWSHSLSWCSSPNAPHGTLGHELPKVCAFNLPECGERVFDSRDTRDEPLRVTRDHGGSVVSFGSRADADKSRGDARDALCERPRWEGDVSISAGHGRAWNAAHSIRADVGQRET